MKKAFILLLLLCFSTVITAKEAKLTFDFVLPSQAGEYHNPYVAIWLENSQGKNARTLVLWREKPKWLKDIRRWWRKVGRRDAELVDAITSATRPAGKYNLAFKGVDKQGKPLAQGGYTLFIEVVRENGGRSIIKHTFTLDNQNKSFNLPILPEISQSVFSISYR